MNNIYEPDTKFNKIFMFIGNTITVGTGCIGFISWIITQITKNIPQVPTWLSYTFKYLFHFCVVIFVLGIIFVLLRIIYVGIKSKSESLYIQRKTTEFLHRQLIHKIRNNIVELEPLFIKTTKIFKRKQLGCNF